LGQKSGVAELVVGEEEKLSDISYHAVAVSSWCLTALVVGCGANRVPAALLIEAAGTACG
jgi:hypothetical protein